jgi:hypothetical protein
MTQDYPHKTAYKFEVDGLRAEDFLTVFKVYLNEIF